MLGLHVGESSWGAQIKTTITLALVGYEKGNYVSHSYPTPGNGKIVEYYRNDFKKN